MPTKLEITFTKNETGLGIKQSVTVIDPPDEQETSAVLSIMALVEIGSKLGGIAKFLTTYQRKRVHDEMAKLYQRWKEQDGNDKAD